VRVLVVLGIAFLAGVVTAFSPCVLPVLPLLLAGSAASEMTTRADKRGDGYVLNGRKHWITGGGVSKLHLIFARVFDERGEALGVGGFLAVRDESKGLRIVRREKTMGLRGIPEGELAFEDLEVPADMAVIPPSFRNPVLTHMRTGWRPRWQ